MRIYLFKYRNLKVQLLRQHWAHIIRCNKCGNVKVVHADENISHNHNKTAIITFYAQVELLNVPMLFQLYAMMCSDVTNNILRHLLNIQCEKKKKNNRMTAYVWAISGYDLTIVFFYNTKATASLHVT